MHHRGCFLTPTGAFVEVVLRCVDKGLDPLGEDVARAVYFHMGSNFGLIREDIPLKPEEFLEALRSVFGADANVIERSIAQEIKSAVGLNMEENDFIKVVEEARRVMSTKS